MGRAFFLEIGLRILRKIQVAGQAQTRLGILAIFFLGTSPRGSWTAFYLKGYKGDRQTADRLHQNTQLSIISTGAGRRVQAVAAAVAVAAAATVRWNVIRSSTLDMLISIDEEGEEEEEGEEGEEGEEAAMKLLIELNSEPGAKRGRVVPPRPNHGGCE